MRAGHWRPAGQISPLLQARPVSRIRATWVAFSNGAPDRRRENSAAFSIPSLPCSKPLICDVGFVLYANLEASHTCADLLAGNQLPKELTCRRRLTCFCY